MQCNECCAITVYVFIYVLTEDVQKNTLSNKGPPVPKQMMSNFKSNNACHKIESVFLYSATGLSYIIIFSQCKTSNIRGKFSNKQPEIPYQKKNTSRKPPSDNT